MTRPLTTTAAARLIGLSAHTLIRCMERGELKHWRIPGSAHRRIDPRELERFAQEHGIPLKQEAQ